MQLLKRDFVVTGKNKQYKILKTVSTSPNSVSYQVLDEAGNTYRLKHYQEDAPMLGEARRAFMTLPPMTGVLHPLDASGDSSMEFDVYPEVGEDIGEHKLVLSELIRDVIPQLNQGIFQLHRSGILVRDIMPKHILYDAKTRKAYLSGFSNVALLKGGATATKAAVRGMEAIYYPPEYQKNGWSIYSDYYALGISLLLYVKGAQVFSGMDANTVMQRAQSWNPPGIDKNYLISTPYNMLSTEQKVLYLILGLTIPDPHLRWGVGELRAWGAGYEIPLIQKGTRVYYQFRNPITIHGTACWDLAQTGQVLLNGGAKSFSVLSELEKHLRTAAGYPAIADRIHSILSDSTLSPQGKVFRVGYTMAPNTVGFWWDGTCMKDTSVLVAQYAGKRGSANGLSQMLKDGCFTFLLGLRGIKTPQQQKIFAQFQQLENWEKEEEQKGASRLQMMMGGDRSKTFSIAGKACDNLNTVLKELEKRPSQREQMIDQLFLDPAFRGWVWSKGWQQLLEAAAEQAAREKDSFTAFLLFAEQAGTPAEQKEARRIWMQQGTFSHITWLRENLSAYAFRGDSEPTYVRQLRTLPWSENTSINDMLLHAPAMDQFYRNFVRSTETNPIKIECGLRLEDTKMIRPKRADAFFCCKHDQLEVTPGYISQKGEKQQDQEIKDWCENSFKEAEEWIQNERKQMTSTVGYTEHGFYDMNENGWIAAVVVWSFCSVSLFIASRMIALRYYMQNSFLPTAFLCLVCALIYPAASIFFAFWHHSIRRQRQIQWNRLTDRIKALDQLQKDCKACKNNIRNQLLQGKKYCITDKKEAVSYLNGEYITKIVNYMLSGTYKIAFAISLAAFFAQTVHCSRGNLISVAGAVLYGAILAYMVCRSNRLRAKSAMAAFFFGALSVCFLYNMFHSGMIVGGPIFLLFLRGRIDDFLHSC